MLHKNRCMHDEECFDRSEKMFQDKMNAWSCSCTNTRPCTKPDYPDPMPCPETDSSMELAMAYVKKQTLNQKTVKNCEDALTAGTLFEELHLPFTGGEYCD